MTAAQELLALRQNVKAIEMHLLGLVEGHPSERYPLERLIESWKADLKRGLKDRKAVDAVAMTDPHANLNHFGDRRKALNKLRAYLSRVRSALKKRPLVAGGHRFTFEVSKSNYMLDVSCAEQTNKHLLKFWEPYVTSSNKSAIALVERLFFRIAPDVYIRNVRVNNIADYDKCPVLKKHVKKMPQPSNLYVSSGESAAAFAILETFTNHLKIEAVGTLFSPGVRYARDLVVMGSGTEEPRFDPPERFGFRVSRDGVRNQRGYLTYADEWGEQELKMHALVSRWRNEAGYLVTTVHACHGRAVEAVCQFLSDDGKVAGLLKDSFSPLAMQLVFSTVLQREGAANRSIRIRLLKQKNY